MSVTVARSAGFCWGVRRALDCVLEELKRGRGPFTFYGPLVHNPQVLEALGQRGATVWDGGERNAPGGGTLFLRTHGVSSAEMSRLSQLPVRLCNLTCPRVARVQALARKYASQARDIVILGDPDHAEVIALMSYAGDAAHLIGGPEDIDRLPALNGPVLLAQTTQNKRVFERCARSLSSLCPDLVVENTICDSTDRRQDELRSLCGHADFVVIVGGSRSANTARLTVIARDEEGVPSRQVETADDIEPAEISRHRKILVTAGASTPSWSIRKVRERLLEIQGRTRPVGMLRALLRSMVFSSTHLLAAVIALGAATGLALVGRPWWLPSAAAALTVFGLHNLNALLESSQPRFTSLGRDEYVRAGAGRRLRAISLAMIPLSIATSAAVGPILAAGHAAVWLLFGLYSLPLLDRARFPWSNLRNLPGSRDLLFAGAWSLLISVLPFLQLGGGPGDAHMWLWSAALFALMMSRSLIMDLLDIQGDAFVGRETLPTMLGTTTGRLLLYSSLLVAAGIPSLFLGPAAAGLAVAPAYLAGVSIWLLLRRFPSEIGVRLLIDGGLMLAGAVPLLIWLLRG